MNQPLTALHASTKPLILIVDDNSANLLMLGDLLEGAYRVRLAKSGEQALSAAQLEPRPDLILLDIMMPDMDGYAVIRRLREQAVTADIPVIYVTAKGAGEDEAYGLNLGAADYIAKPINPDVMLARVQTHVAVKRMRDALTAQNLWLENEVMRRVKETSLVQEACMRALAALGDTRDNETGDHIRRTQLYVGVLGRRLAAYPQYREQLNPTRLDTIIKAAALHDIGKIGIPDAILLKPGRLTPEEFEVMKRHAEIGGQAIDRALRELAADNAFGRSMLAACAHPNAQGGPLDFLIVAREIAALHHERWDGSGYPNGLAGEVIPLPARLMALADVFDALISRRVYKEPLPLEEVTCILVAERGRQFDPDIVDVYLECKEELDAIAQRYPERVDERASAAAAA
ncbi:MAG TPA: response regulator [Gammaproteobacteria bacterium]|nr:response regulator [Gammaproteobacteria bacterium]